jgi:succinyl-CoA synthetase alpha subunit
MPTKILVRKNEYYDSVFLMGINNRIMKSPGILQSGLLMGSEANKEVLIDLGFTDPLVNTASPNDLVIAVQADSQTYLDVVTNNLGSWLTEVETQKRETEYHTLNEVIEQNTGANLVSISLPGEYAAAEARKSIAAGFHVFLFSDNVSVEDEKSLKLSAREKGLLVMGPDCGTSIINGIGLGFANKVRRGSIGVVAAAGTGLQEFTSMVHNLGGGISQAIGTGGRDLKDEIGGLTTFSALDILAKDGETEVIAIVSKPPGEKTLRALVEQFTNIHKPVIACFLGIEGSIPGETEIFERAKTIDQAVFLALKKSARYSKLERPIQALLKPEGLPFKREQKFMRGILAGGTFCYQSQQIFREAGIIVYSNSPIEKHLALKDPNQSESHSVVDMGDEYFMVGRPHPMIDGSQRARRILQEARDPNVAIILLDFILGFNASKDPVGEIIDSIHEARHLSAKDGRVIEFVASICGTAEDAQDLAMQTVILEEAKVKVFASNATAVQYSAQIIKDIGYE